MLSPESPRKNKLLQLITWVSGVSGGKGERWKRKREIAEGEKRLTQMLLMKPSTPTQHDSIPSNQNHFRSLGCQLHVSKRSPSLRGRRKKGRGRGEGGGRKGKGNSSVRMKSKHLWKISMASPCRSLCSYLLAVGDVRGYCVLSNHFHIQWVTRFAEWFCVRPSLLFSPSHI